MPLVFDRRDSTAESASLIQAVPLRAAPLHEGALARVADPGARRIGRAGDLACHAFETLPRFSLES